MATKKLTKKQMDKHLSGLYARNCEGIQVSIMHLGAISNAGEAVLVAGGTDEEAGKAMRELALKKSAA